MEILLITDTYLSSVPFGGEVIKPTMTVPAVKMQTRSKKAVQAGEKSCMVNWA